MELAEKKAEYVDTLLHIIDQVFHKFADVNVQKVGLVYLASILNYYPQLCERYLEVLLEIHNDIMLTVLSTTDIDVEGYIIYSTSTFKYFRTGAPLNWNSPGIVTALNTYVKDNELERFDLKHIEIIRACLVRQIQPEDKELWLSMYEDLKRYIFISLTVTE